MKNELNGILDSFWFSIKLDSSLKVRRPFSLRLTTWDEKNLRNFNLFKNLWIHQREREKGGNLIELYIRKRDVGWWCFFYSSSLSTKSIILMVILWAILLVYGFASTPPPTDDQWENLCNNLFICVFKQIYGHITIMGIAIWFIFYFEHTHVNKEKVVFYYY